MHIVSSIYVETAPERGLGVYLELDMMVLYVVLVVLPLSHHRLEGLVKYDLVTQQLSMVVDISMSQQVELEEGDLQLRGVNGPKQLVIYRALILLVKCEELTQHQPVVQSDVVIWVGGYDCHVSLGCDSRSG